MDGVLVDNMRIHARAYDIFYERHGVGNRQNVLKELSGLGNDEIMQRLFTPERLAELGGWQALSEEKEAIYRELYEPLIRPTAGLLDFLEALRREGIACAVGSSAEMRNIRFVFEKCGIESYFQTVVSSEQVTRCKPDPEIYLRAAAALGAETLTVYSGIVFPLRRAVRRRAVTGLFRLRTPLLRLAGVSVVVITASGTRLVLPAVPAEQAAALTHVLAEEIR